MKKTIGGRKMIKFKSNIIKTVFFAGLILVLSVGVLFASLKIAQGAEEKTVVSNSSTYSNVKLGLLTRPSQSPQVTGEAIITGEPGPGCISGEQAVGIFTDTATKLFGISVNKSALTVQFRSDKNTLDNKEYVHQVWDIEGQDCICGIDAMTGTVITFTYSAAYTGTKITIGDFDSGKAGNITAPTGYGPVDINNSPDDIYINAAKKLVNEYLAGGRKIDNIEIDGVQFVWDNNSDGFKPDAPGTIQVDCHVYMETGMCYIMSFWGTEQLELREFDSAPTKQACEAGFYWPEDAAYSPPYGWKGPWPEPSSSSVPSAWETAPGLTNGQYSPLPSDTPRPSDSSRPSN